tara:strand:+ start:1757 stop:2974 length:1218 start_codon:yes stop_codon:yes gene_type:complete
MPGHTRSIYSRRQRMAPGQYDNPLADFLDNLPGYINQFQQNQLALGRQQLQEQRYQDSIARQNRLDAENQKRYETSQALAAKAVEENNRRFEIQREDIDINRRRADDQFIKTNVMSLVRAGKYGLAEQMLSGLEGPEVESLGAVIRQERDSKEELDSAFKDVRKLYYDPNVSVYEKQDRLNSFQEKYSDRFELGKGIDDSITRFISATNLKAEAQNRGFRPVEEWITVKGGREDIATYENALSAIKEAQKEMGKLEAGVEGVFGTKEKFLEIIDKNERIVQRLRNKPQYKLETRNQYNERKKMEKLPLGAMIPLGVTQDQFYASSAFNQGTDEEFLPSSENDMADFEDSLNKELDQIVSSPSEEKIEEPKSTLQNILNLPEAQAARRRPLSIVDPIRIARLLNPR